MTEEEKGDWNVSTVLLSQEDIRKVMDLKEVVEITEKTFKGFGEGTTINPTKVGLDLGETAAYPPYQGFMNAALKEALKGTDTEAIKKATEALQKPLYELSAAAYQAAGAQGAQAGPQPGAGNAQQEEKKNDDDVVDADFTDVNDKK